MSATATRMPLAEAQRVAGVFRSLFDGPPCYARWEVAGSVRRRCPRVGDIEHVVVPSRAPDSSALFDTQTVNAMHARLDALVLEGTIARSVYSDGRHRWGPRYRGVDFGGVRHELFFARPDTLGTILAIRTGPGELSKRLVQGVRYVSRERYRVEGGALLDTHENTQVPTPEEADFWKHTGMTPCAPERRELLLERLQGSVA